MDRDDVQGLIFSGYSRLRASALIRLRFDGGEPNAWLTRLLPVISAGSRLQRFAAFQLNVALTFAGLAKLGLPQATLGEFPRALREGMAELHRSRALGDVGEDDPACWEFGGDVASTPDAVLLAYAESSELLAERLDELRAGFERFGLQARELATFLPADGREHFGAHLGGLEPRFAGNSRGRAHGRRLARGEFLLGHRDGIGLTQRGPIAPRLVRSRRAPRGVGLGLGPSVDLGHNGSYLVVRKLEQRVDAFEAFIAEAERSGMPSELARARVFGRWPNGAALALHPDFAPSEGSPRRVRYDAEDPDGRGCPFHAHARRAYPSGSTAAGRDDVERHRLLRRGRLYGPESRRDEGERGLLFVALNASIERQFEVVQGRWLAGGESGEPDALARFVRVRGGVYAFLPSLSALGYLADVAGAGARKP